MDIRHLPLSIQREADFTVDRRDHHRALPGNHRCIDSQIQRIRNAKTVTQGVQHQLGIPRGKWLLASRRIERDVDAVADGVCRRRNDRADCLARDRVVGHGRHVAGRGSCRGRRRTSYEISHHLVGESRQRLSEAGGVGLGGGRCCTRRGGWCRIRRGGGNAVRDTRTSPRSCIARSSSHPRQLRPHPHEAERRGVRRVVEIHPSLPTFSEHREKPVIPNRPPLELQLVRPVVDPGIGLQFAPLSGELQRGPHTFYILLNQRERVLASPGRAARIVRCHEHRCEIRVSVVREPCAGLCITQLLRRDQPIPVDVGGSVVEPWTGACRHSGRP